MRSKAPLALMEQAVMILVFALAAALCLRVFVWSDRMSHRLEDRDQAVVRVQTAAEHIKYEGRKGGNARDVLAAAAQEMGGVCENDLFTIDYDADWNISQGRGSYQLNAREVPSDVPGLEQVRVWVPDGDSEETLFEVEVAWQGKVE